LLLLSFIACRREDSAPAPDSTWSLFRSPATGTLSSTVAQKLDGIYTIEQGREAFGSLTRRSGAIQPPGATRFITFPFFWPAMPATLFVRGRRLDSAILLDGYWRKQVGTDTGKVRLTIAKDSGAAMLLRNGLPHPDSAIILTVCMATGTDIPDQPLQMRFTRRFLWPDPFQIIAHRGGGPHG
jgi:hypothetical protein